MSTRKKSTDLTNPDEWMCAADWHLSGLQSVPSTAHVVLVRAGREIIGRLLASLTAEQRKKILGNKDTP